VALKVRLLAIALFACSFMLAWKALSLFGATSHFGSPALQVCPASASPEMAVACRTFRTQFWEMLDQYGSALDLLGLAAVVVFFLGAAALTLSVEIQRTPPNNSFKPKPLRGSA
jgi:hypothetical protein